MGKYKEAFDIHAKQYLDAYEGDKELARAIREARVYYLTTVVPQIRSLRMNQVY